VRVAWVGTSGWSYGHWDGVLYPPGTAPAKRLDVYQREFATVELNASFYRWPHTGSFSSWQRRLRPGFQMSVKAPRGLTHGRLLYSPEVWVDRLDWFLGRLPWWVRTAVELRHPSWHADEVFALLERHQASYCVMSGAGLPCVLRATAPFVYVRLHGPSPDHLYGGSYSDQDLAWWADRIREWQGAGREVFAYFNNDGDGHAVRNARRLRELLS
jgi:uncharacterized protein YecE (DUF72 family)